MTPSEKTDANQPTKQRKTYTRPKLTCFGKIDQLTESNNGKIGNPDGGGSKWAKTGL